MMPFFNRNPWMMPPPPLDQSRGSKMVHSRFQGRLGNRNNRFQYANQQHNFSNVRKGLHPSNIQRTIFNSMPPNTPRNAGCNSTTNHNNHRQPGFLHTEFSSGPFRGNNGSLHSFTNSTADGNGLGGSSNVISPSLRGPFSPSVGFGSNLLNQSLNPILREDYRGKVQFDNVRRPAQKGVVAGASKSSVCPDTSIGFIVKKQLCKNYFRGHGCRNGDNCSFMHKDFPCWLFHVRGSCPEGICCKFSHDDLSAVTRRTLVGNMVKYKDLFPSMSYKEIQAAINVVSARREKTSGIRGDDDDVIILDVETDVAEVPRQVSNDHPNLWVMSSLVDGQSSHEHISFPHATHYQAQREAPSLHEIVQRTRRVINQSEMMWSDGNGELSALNNRQTHPPSGPLFTTITKPVDFKGVPQRKGRATMDAVIESCIGHGPPYTNWQICLIYNACAQNGLNLDTSDLQKASSSRIAP